MGFLGALIGAGASIAGGLIGSSAAKNAAQQQVQGTTNASNYAKQTLSNQQGTIGQGLAQQQALLQPYQQLGQQATANLSSLAGTPGQGLLSNWTGQFQAPTAEQAAATPGYQFQIDQANEQAQNSAAARGGLLSGGTAKALANYNQGLASENYGNTYNRAFNEYQQKYGEFQQGQQNQYNRLSGLAGIGQWGAGTGVNAIGQATGMNVGAQGQAGQQVGNYLQNIGTENASGTIGAANAWNSALSGAASAGSGYATLSSLNGQGGGGAGAGTGGSFNGGMFGLPGAALPVSNQSGYDFGMNGAYLPGGGH